MKGHCKASFKKANDGVFAQFAFFEAGKTILWPDAGPLGAGFLLAMCRYGQFVVFRPGVHAAGNDENLFETGFG